MASRERLRSVPESRCQRDFQRGLFIGCILAFLIPSYAHAGTFNGSSHYVLEGEYNGDGYPDIYLKPKVLILPGGVSTPLLMSLKHIILQNNGSGSYTVVNNPNIVTISSVNWIAGAHTVVGGDFDGDGDDDALLQAMAVADDSYVLMVDGSGNVALGETINASTFGFDIATQAGVSISASDLDGDGDDDLIFNRPGYSLSYGYFYSTGTNTGYFGSQSDGLSPPAAFTSPTLAGTTSYTVDVSSRGNSVIDIPISVVPGVNGMQPALSIHYDLGSDRTRTDNLVEDAVLGSGWSLRGLSNIRRCEQRSVIVDLSLTSTDRLCLDGQLLVATSGTYWSSGTVYKTELETFTKVVQNGAAANASFTVYTADGRVSTYGGVSGAQIAAANTSTHFVWAINESKDRYDNKIVYTYHKKGNGEYYPIHIDYAGARVSFEYENRPQEYLISLILTGSAYSDRTVALHTIRTSMNGTPVRVYRIDNQYDELANEYYTRYVTRVHGIQECGFDEYGSGVDCLPAMEFGWYGELSWVFFITGVNQITDGLGAVTTFEYTPVSFVSLIPPTFSGPFFPERPFHTTTVPSSQLVPTTYPTLVSAMIRSDGRSGTRRINYLYSSEIYADIGNRGYIGPGAQRVEDVSRGTFTYRIKRLEFPYSGLVTEERTYNGVYGVGGTQLVGASLTDWATVPFNSGLTHMLYSREQTIEQREQGLLSAVEQTAKSFQNTYSEALHTSTIVDQFASGYSTGTAGTKWGEIPDINPTGIERTQTSVAIHGSPNTSSWLVNFVTDRNNTYTASGETTRTTSTDYVAASGTVRTQSIINFPGNPDLEVEITNAFDSFGNLTEVDIDSLDPSVVSRDLHFTSYADSRYPTTITNSEEHVQSILYDPRFGTSKQVTDANGLVSYITRDALGRVILQERPDGTQVQNIYDDCSGCATVQGATPRFKVTQTVTHLVTSQQGAPDVHRYHDELGRVIREEHQGFDGSLIRSDVIYDSLGRVDRAYLPSTGTPTTFVDYNYDYKDRVVSEDPPGSSGGLIAVQYRDSASHATEVAVTETIEGGASTTTQMKVSRFNVAGQLIETLDGCTSIACTNGSAIQTEYDYDAFGNLDWTRVDGNAATVTTMVYDDAGNKISISEPNSGTTSFNYDALGLLRSQTDARSQVTAFTYDLMDRLTVRVDGSTSNTWTYDTDYAGALEKVVQSNGGEQFREEYTYDSLVRLTNTTTTIPEHSGSFEFSVSAYDEYSRPVDLEYPSGLDISKVYNTYGYDEETRRTGGSSISRVTNANAFGNVTGLALGNGLTTTMGYDNNSGRLTSINTGSIQDNDYVWRSNGALHSRVQSVTTEVFSYDQFNRLTQALISGVRTLAYQYNDLGNITSKTDTDGDNLTSWSYTGPRPHAVKSVNIAGVSQTYSYDASGNATSARGRTIAYNSFNKPTTISYPAGAATTSFEYGPDQARFRQYAEYTAGANFYQVQTFYVAGGLYEKVITTVNYSTTTTTERCYVGDSYLEVGCGGTSPVQYYLLRDHLGSIDAITNASGSVVDDMAFDPYGLRRKGDWSEPLALAAANLISDAKTARGFTHHEHLDRTGFIHMNGRLYDPVIGRFLSADPFVVNPADSQSYNRYSYVQNSPLSFTDPTGFFIEEGGGRRGPIDHIPRGVDGFRARWRGIAAAIESDLEKGVFFPSLPSSVVGVVAVDVGETAFRTLVYDYEDPLFGSHWWESATLLPILKPLKLLKLTKSAARAGGATVRNAHLAGKVHPKTGIPFDRNGFPDFSSVSRNTVQMPQTGNRAADFAAANRAAGLPSTPRGYTWHHHQDGRTMQLVPTDIHRATGHTGGVALGGGGP